MVGKGGSQYAEAARTTPSAAAVAGAVACAGVAVFIVATTALITFGLSESYGFGPAWDLSAFVMTAGAAAATGSALVGAVRLIRPRLRAFPVMMAAMVAVFATGYLAGMLGNSLHH